MARARASLTVIARDEEKNLPACLGPAAGLFDEVVVLDTGSKDRTREVAAQFGARVYEVPWADDFAAARNAALDRATGAWAFRLDADDRLDPPDVERLRALLASLPDRHDAFAVRYTHDRGSRSLVLDEVRLFPNRPDVRWRYRVHEQIAPAVLAAGGSIRVTDVRLRHEGYRDPAVLRRKLERNLRLLELDLVDRPRDPFVLFYAGWTRLGLGDPAGALAPLERACRGAPPGFPLLPACHALLARSYLGQRKPELALAACRAGRTASPRDADLACLEGEALLAAGNPAEAAAAFRSVLAGGYEENDQVPVAGGTLARARHGLASALPPDRAAEREALWRQAVAEQPDFGPAWLGLGESLTSRGEWAELERVARAAEEALPGRAEGIILRARRAGGRGDYRGARRELERYCARHTGAVLPRLALARVLLLEGRDQVAARRVLAEVLSLDPGHPEGTRLLRFLPRWDQGGG